MPDRPLPEAPKPAYSPGRRSPLRSPVTENPFDSPSRQSPSRFSSTFSAGLSAHGSPLGSPVRRSRIWDEEDDADEAIGRGLELGNNTGSRPLPPNPFASPSASRRPLPETDFNKSTTTLASNDELIVSKNIESEPEVEGELDDDDDASTLAMEPPLENQPRRNKSISRKQVKLVKGNLVLDCPVPTKLYSFLPRRDSDEFVHMRYSAVTSDPDDFAEDGFTIRPAIYDRQTEICICITMYNEDETLFTRTLHAVFKNIAYLCQRSNSKVWGPNGWKKVVLTIIADGRTKVSPRVLDCLAAIGVYQDGVAKNFVNGAEVRAHLFEYTAQVCLTEDMRFQGAEKNLVPVQVMFCMKEKNAKKINSHRWFFNAVCPQLNPNVTVLLDVGTRPTTQTLYHLWKAFDEDSNVAGACGEIKTMIGKFGTSLFNPLVAAQNFEYKISNILDKPFESVFGYISVLPGALSAYRYRALENNPDGTGPLCSYFKGEKLDDDANAGIFEKNMYLAEDRILCWELVAKRQEKWVLKYVPAAKGETDVPESLAEFISQRRRWLNGALFAALYSQWHFRQIWGTAHGTIRKIFFHLEFFYQFMTLLFTFFGIANFYLTFYFVAGSVAGNNDATIPHHGGEVLFLFFKYILTLAIAAQFVLSLGNRPQGARALFMTTVVTMSVVIAYATIIGLYFVARTFTVAGDGDTKISTLLTIVVSLVSTYGLYAIMSFVWLDPWHVLTSSLQYFLLVPLYVCTLQTYAFCNTHDVSWGTKGDNEPKLDLGEAVVMKRDGMVEVSLPSDQLDIDTGYDNVLHSLRERIPTHDGNVSAAVRGTDYYRNIRSLVVLIWMICNLLLVMLITQFWNLDRPGNNVYLQIVVWSMAVFAACRSIGSSIFLIQRGVRWIHKTHLHTSENLRAKFSKKDETFDYS